MEEREGRVSHMDECMVVEIGSVFNAINGMPKLYAFKAVPSTYHPANGTITTIYGKQVELRSSYRKSIQLAKPSMLHVEAKEEVELERL